MAKDTRLWSLGEIPRNVGSNPAGANFFIFENIQYNMVKIGSFRFGSLTINNKTYDNDMTISWDGEINSRESTHTFSKEELLDLLLKGPDSIVIGTGTAGNVVIAEEADKFAKKKNIELIVKKTPEAIEEFNKISKNKKVIAVIHVTC